MKNGGNVRMEIKVKLNRTKEQFMEKDRYLLEVGHFPGRCERRL
jgi:hypothetical protein